MSSDFERRLRGARDALPQPSEAVTRRARERAIAAAGRRSLKRPAVAILAAALLGLGIGIGALIAPSGSAAPAPLGLGFLPERGWSVVQNGGDGTPAWPATAIAANVELSPKDDPDGLPLSTLESLPADGVVIIATFIARGDQPWHDRAFPERTLPLDALAAARGIQYGVQVRPGRPLGQYQLRAAVERHNVDISIYFGTDRPSRVLFAAAQRQLDRLVVHPVASKHPESPRAAADISPATAGATVFDRTFACMPSYGAVDVVASRHGTSEIRGGHFISSGFVRVTTGAGADLLSDLVVVAHPGHRSPTANFPAAAYASSRRCVVSQAFVPLTRTGLAGPAATWSTRGECSVRGKVLIRVRAVLRVSAKWGPVGTTLVGTRGRLRDAALAARDQRSGKPLAFARLDGAGNTQLWTSARCQ